MTRRDTIIIAALINAGLLAILFATAWHGDEDKVSDNPEVSQVMSEAKSQQPSTSDQAPVASGPRDELDQVLQRYVAAQQQGTTACGDAMGVEVTPSQVAGDPQSAQSFTAVATVPAAQDPQSDQSAAESSFIQVIVKKGDVLAKIARAHGTTVDKLMKANNLKNVNLRVGQVLRVPKSEGQSSLSTSASKNGADKEAAMADIKYYTVQAGDNPSSIARKCKMPVDELLRMNNLDNDKARNLKIGDRLKVK